MSQRWDAPVRWALKLELTTDDGKTQASEVRSIGRSSSDVQHEEVGLTLEEGQLLLRDIVCRLIADQVHACTMPWRRCPHCGRQQYFKDMRTKCVRTVHGAYPLRSRRARQIEPQQQEVHSQRAFQWDRRSAAGLTDVRVERRHFRDELRPAHDPAHVGQKSRSRRRRTVVLKFLQCLLRHRASRLPTARSWTSLIDEAGQSQ